MPDRSRDTYRPMQHLQGMSGNPMLPPTSDLVRVGSRRWFLQTGLAGLGGFTLADALRGRGIASTGEVRAPKSVILLWLSGGPSQIDMWDPKPDAPAEIHGPYQSIETALPGVRFCEHLPLHAKLADKMTVLRSVDCSASNHTPITMQAGNAQARRSDDGKDGQGYPSMGSIVAKFRGANRPGIPPFVGLADSWKADVWGAGHMGAAYEPVQGRELQGRLALTKGIDLPRLADHDRLRQQFDRLARNLDAGDVMAGVDRYNQMALEMLVSDRTRQAFEIHRESDKIRDLYGRESLGEKALLARRLVEAGVSFVLVSGAWGYFDHHGDEVKWGGIEKGLTPLLPRVDRVMHALVHDLEVRGLLDSTLVLMMGEFGRAPVMTATRGRGHWVNAMSMLMAGGGLKHGQVIGATDRRGGDIKERPIRPADIAASTFQFLGIDLASHWINPQGRPIPIVMDGGQPIEELF